MARGRLTMLSKVVVGLVAVAVVGLGLQMGGLIHFGPLDGEHGEVPLHDGLS